MVGTGLASISKSLHICAFDFSRLATAFIIPTVVSISNAQSKVSCICRPGYDGD